MRSTYVSNDDEQRRIDCSFVTHLLQGGEVKGMKLQACRAQGDCADQGGSVSLVNQKTTQLCLAC
jgi:hypothetical protein